MKRVICLYRVSTKQQVNAEDDIPMQRRECLEYIALHPDWIFIGERLEKGVSGYKLLAAQRDAIIELKDMAEKRMFDVLLVFMFDRLGRREDETPFLVEWFISRGIEVWSTREGETKLETRSDKLINYIRYWQAGGESEKTSMRVTAAHTQMTQDGIWRGGGHPYGYRLVHKNRVNKRGHPLWDFEIDEEQAKQIREIYRLYCEEGHGTYILAKLMNEKYPSETKQWSPGTIRQILKNPVYTGRMHMNDVLSSPLEELRIISDDTFNFAQVVMKNHIQNRYSEARQRENTLLSEDIQTKAELYGATLLAGLLVCAHCGKRLVGGYCTKQRNEVVYHRPVYRCYNTLHCTGQRVYSSKKIEPVILEIFQKYLQRLRDEVDPDWLIKNQNSLQEQVQKRQKELVEEYARLNEEAVTLREEVMKSLKGESAFSTDYLAELVMKNHEALENNAVESNRIIGEMESTKKQLRKMNELHRFALDWSDIFLGLPEHMKKMIMARFVEKITVNREYHLTVFFYVLPEHFAQEHSREGVCILLAEHPLTWTV